MTAWQIVYYGQPAGMPRMRTRRTRFGVLHYVPPKAPGTLFRNAIRLKAADQEKLTGPVALRIECLFAMPVSWSKAKKAKHFGKPHTQKPDGDNVAKAVMDGLTAAGVWPDDAVVWSLEIRKVWAVQGYCTILAVDSGRMIDETDTDEKPEAQLEGERGGVRDVVPIQGSRRKPTHRRGDRDSGNPNPWAGDVQREGTKDHEDSEG
jgi:Holliday junction resolvase RusA-like endonuclease